MKRFAAGLLALLVLAGLSLPATASSITTRAGKGSALTASELDANFKQAAQTKSGNYTVVESDNRDTIEVSASATITLTAAATILAASDTGDFQVTIKNTHASANVTVTRSASDTINGATSYTIYPGGAATFKINNGGNGWNVIGATEMPAFFPNVSGQVTASQAELNYNDITTLGTSQASKVVTADSSGNITLNSGTVLITALNATGGSVTGITDLAIADGGTGASTAAAAFNNIKQAASTSATGVVELATSAETIAGTDTSRAVTPDGLAAAMPIFVNNASGYPTAGSDTGGIDPILGLYTKNSWTSIGPSTGVATKAWGALTDVPAGVAWIEVKIVGQGNHTGGTAGSHQLVYIWARKHGSSVGQADAAKIFSMETACNTVGNGWAGGVTTVRIPVDSNRVFDINYNSSFNDISNATLYLTGWGYNGS